MKKYLIVLIAAVCCFSSCLKYEETDCIYEIGFTYVGTSSESIITPSESENLIKEYKAAFSDFEKSYSDEWIVTVQNKKYSSPDSKAKAKYASVLKETKSFHESWQKRFKECTDTKSSYEVTYKVFLSRFSESGTVNLEEEKFSIEFNL